MVNFDYSDYRMVLFFIPLTMVTIFTILLITTLLQEYFNKDRVVKNNSRSDKLKSILFMFICVFFIVNYSLQLNLKIINDDKNDAVEIRGQIDNIKSSFVPIKHTHRGEVVGGKYIIIDDQQYYVMDNAYFDIGDEVILTVLPRSNVVLFIERDES